MGLIMQRSSNVTCNRKRNNPFIKLLKILQMGCRLSLFKKISGSNLALLKYLRLIILLVRVFQAILVTWKRLTHLDLSFVGFGVFICQQLRHLSEIYFHNLQGNDLCMNALWWVSHLSSINIFTQVANKLSYLSLGSSNLRGQVHSTKLNFWNLNMFLSSSQLRGKIPNFLDQFWHLAYLSLTTLESWVLLSYLEGVKILHRISWRTMCLNCILLKSQNKKNLDLSSNSIVMNVCSNGTTFELNFFKVSSCQISPQFPTWLQTQKSYSLTGLHFLNLSQIHLMGKVLEKEGNMILLEFPDLSVNNLFSEIAQSI
ncbi:receptor-like protein eix2 [Quercus suber]|uniref:Receptor-like protein eix2 n=1 Tax=Quercus suber TaxID=58331 RepID=A0AAW0JS29_QUESU